MLVSRVRLLFLLISLTFVNSVSALDVPLLRGRVNDYARVMPSERVQVLEQRLAGFEQETGHQIAVLTIPSLKGEDLEGFSIRVAESWKIGKKGFDNGVILLIAKNDRKLRIEVGYGLEGILPDAIASRIIREVIVPHFRADDYAGGIETGIEAIMKVASGEHLPAPARTPTKRTTTDPSLVIGTLLLAAVIAFIVGITHRTLFRGAFSGAATAALGSLPATLGSGMALWILILLVGSILGAVGSLYAREAWGKPWTVRGSRRERWARDALYGGAGTAGGWDDFGGGGGFSGGGFGGGGGGFGGGGASGSW